MLTFFKQALALDGVLGQIGDKDNHHLQVHLPDMARRRHTVQEGHDHIQQKQVKFRTVPLYQFLSLS